MIARAAQIVRNAWFQRIIFAMILLAGVLAGLGIVMNSMAEMHAELDEQKEAREPDTALQQLADMEKQLHKLRSSLQAQAAKFHRHES